MNDKIESAEYVDLRKLVPEVSENLVRDRYINDGTMIVDLTAMYAEAEGGTSTLLVDRDRTGFRTMPRDLSDEKKGRIWEAGWLPARLILVERVVDEVDTVVADITIVVNSRLETYRVGDSSDFSFDDEVEIIESQEAG